MDPILPPDQAIAAAKELLAGLTFDEVRAVVIEALRRARRDRPSELQFQMNDGIGRNLVLVLSERRGNNAAGFNFQQSVKETFLSQQSEPWMQSVLGSMWWLVRAGLAIPVYHAPGYPVRYHMTDAGLRFLDDNEDHPCLPAFVERLTSRCKDLPDEVVAHLVDARTCLDHGLGRPAVSLSGLAYEAAADAAIEYLEKNRGFVPPKNGKAAARIADVMKFIPVLFGGDREKEGRAIAAWDFADRLRDRRNQASHPRNYPDFSDLSEVHEFLQSAGRHLPGFWSVRV